MRKDKFYFYWGVFFLLIVAVAFAPRYWIPLANNALDFTADVHWHALFSTVWILLFFIQVSLVHFNRPKSHQLLGLLSLVVTAGVVFTGLWVSVELTKRALLAENPGAKPVLLINSLDVLMFGILYSIGFIKRKDIANHKRIMTLAAIVLLNAGFFRIGRFLIGGGFLPILMAIVITSSVIILFAYLDKRRNQQFNQSVKKIAITVILIHILRIPIAITPVWTSITDWILSIT